MVEDEVRDRETGAPEYKDGKSRENMLDAYGEVLDRLTPSGQETPVDAYRVVHPFSRDVSSPRPAGAESIAACLTRH